MDTRYIYGYMSIIMLYIYIVLYSGMSMSIIIIKSSIIQKITKLHKERPYMIRDRNTRKYLNLPLDRVRIILPGSIFLGHHPAPPLPGLAASPDDFEPESDGRSLRLSR